MISLLIIALVGAAVFYLGTAALITQWLWSAYSPMTAAFMGCAACTGTWVGLGAGFWLDRHAAGVLGVRGVPSIFLGGAAGMVLTPIAAAIMLYALHLLTPPAPSGPEA